MKITPYLNFNGSCAKAFAFYARVLNGTVTFMMTWGESPAAEQTPREAHGLVMHATLTVGDTILMAADALPGQYEPPQGMNVSLQLEDATEAKRVFDELVQQGLIKVPFASTFWSPGFGMCIDQFGIPWMINTESIVPG